MSTTTYFLKLGCNLNDLKIYPTKYLSMSDIRKIIVEDSKRIRFEYGEDNTLHLYKLDSNLLNIKNYGISYDNGIYMLKVGMTGRIGCDNHGYKKIYTTLIVLKFKVHINNS